MTTTSPTSDSAAWLKAGITALQAGDRSQARELLLRVVEVAEDNEVAWLWLSGAMETAVDRRVCLENVLALNPANERARRGLAKLAAEEQRNTDDGRYGETAVVRPTSAFDDVWEQAVDICAYCAQEVGQEKSCPRCKRPLTITTFRYEKPEATLHIFWVLLVAIAQLYFLTALYNIIARQSMWAAVLPATLMVVFLILTGGVYWRQFWAYVGALLALALVLFAGLVGLLLPAEFNPANLFNIGPMFDDVVNPVVRGLGDVLTFFQMLAVALALFVGAFKTGPDFERVQRRQIATLQKGLQDASSYHDAASRAAKRGEWATAVLHWQRAAAKAPGQVSFQRHLALAYARLGFYQRSLDVLQMALPHTHDPDLQSQLKRLQQTVQKQLDSPTTGRETNHG
jgi:tetratricopeptide (TPR) repeat protein